MDILNKLRPLSVEEAFYIKTNNNLAQEFDALFEKNNSEYNPLPLNSNKLLNNGTLQTRIKPQQEIVNQYSKPFIEANTQEIKLKHLQNDCIIPVFSKDNEKTISHQEFIEIAQNSISNIYPTLSHKVCKLKSQGLDFII